MYLKITIHLHSFIKPTSSFKRLCPISSNNDLHKIHHVYYMYNITSYHIYMYMFSYLYFEHLKIYMFLSFLCVHCILLIDRCPFVFQVVIGITAKILHFYSSKLIELKKNPLFNIMKQKYFYGPILIPVNKKIGWKPQRHYFFCSELFQS